MVVKCVNDFEDYELLDCGDEEKIERFGEYILRRPDPQAIWRAEDFNKYKVNAIYHRSKSGGGTWEFIDLPKKWTVSYKLDGDKKISFNLKPFTFKHTGIFPEQAVNWNCIYNFCDAHQKQNINTKVLNLFAYTGGATLAAAIAGVKVTHVDAAKGIVTWAKENAELSKVPSDRIRWIVDDCKKFVEREIRRGNLYDVIIMDPPSYGRGPSGEVWKLEKSIYDFVRLTLQLLNPKDSLFILNSYTTGLQPGTMNYIVNSAANKNNLTGASDAYEIGLFCETSKLILPEGSTVVFKTD